jgi:hypothetical protein
VKKYKVQVTYQQEKTYRVEADNADEAGEYGLHDAVVDGLIDVHVLSVEEEKS